MRAQPFIFHFHLTKNKISDCMENSFSENQWDSKKLLIAEDEDSNYKYLEIVLRKTGIEIFRAHNGLEAIEITKKHPGIDLVLMDVKMPEMNGLEATKEIKKMNGYIPVIALTAYAMANDREMSLNAGCDDYISKPVRKHMIYSMLHKYLDD